jgi:L-alanine-DL-glutamate epimerase-like enolase superfamily enzyme
VLLGRAREPGSPNTALTQDKLDTVSCSEAPPDCGCHAAGCYDQSQEECHVRVVDVRERSIEISRYRDHQVPSGGLTTSLVAVVTDVIHSGRPVVGYGYASVGRYAQGGLIRERFAPRLLAAPTQDIATDDGTNLDPFRAWALMLTGEKPGGHGERCVAVGAIDMALWDAAAKIADVPLYRLLADRLGREVADGPVPVYASGGYPYPDDDLTRLDSEIQRFADLGFTHAKIKIGAAPLDEDLRRIEVAAARLGASENLAVDAMNVYHPAAALAAAAALEHLGLRWFEDICDPLDFATHARLAERYIPPIAAGEALFSEAEAALLDTHGGLRRDRDVLVFDPVHCYGLPGYLNIVRRLTAGGWPLRAFWPHGGHMFSVHLVAALGLGGAEVNPFAFHPFHGPPTALPVSSGLLPLPPVPGIGFELHNEAWQAFRCLA